MSKTVADIEADLAAAKAAEAEAQAVERAKAEVEAAERRAREAIEREIGDTEAGIAHLEQKIAARRARVAELKALL